MTDQNNPNGAYQIAVSYGTDAGTTTVNLKLMTFDLGKLVVGQEFTEPSDQLDLFINQVRQAIYSGVGVTGDIVDASPLSIQRILGLIIFDAPFEHEGVRTLKVVMTITDASAMVDELDAVQDAIKTFLDAGVVFLAAA
jgi:hypothetical protein